MPRAVSTCDSILLTRALRTCPVDTGFQIYTCMSMDMTAFSGIYVHVFMDMGEGARTYATAFYSKKFNEYGPVYVYRYVYVTAYGHICEWTWRHGDICSNISMSCEWTWKNSMSIHIFHVFKFHVHSHILCPFTYLHVSTSIHICKRWRDVNGTWTLISMSSYSMSIHIFHVHSHIPCPFTYSMSIHKFHVHSHISMSSCHEFTHLHVLTSLHVYTCIDMYTTWRIHIYSRIWAHIHWKNSMSIHISPCHVHSHLSMSCPFTSLIHKSPSLAYVNGHGICEWTWNMKT